MGELTGGYRAAVSRGRLAQPRLVALTLGVLAFGAGAPASAHLHEPEPYRYVEPPAAEAATNVAPNTATSTHPADPTIELIAATDDVQALLTLPAGSLVPPVESDEVEVTLRPVAPSSLAALPDDEVAIGNVYGIEITAIPAGDAVDTLDATGYLTLSAPVHTDVVLFSADGESWEALETFERCDGHGTLVKIERTGYYVQIHDGVDPAEGAPHEMSEICGG